MEQSRKILNNINVPTAQLNMDVIQELLLLSKRDYKFNKEFWNEVSDKLWAHLMQCLEKLDDQLLCATCFYSMITLTDKQDCYLDKVLYVVGREPNSPSQHIRRHVPSSQKHYEDIPTFNILERNNSVHTLQVVSLIYGMFQSSFLTQKSYENIEKIVSIIKEMFNILLLMGYQYSQYTFLVFKTLKSFKKVCGGPLEMYIFNTANQIKVLGLINNNWENPVTGVRDFNRSIFQTLLSTLDEETYKIIFDDINKFYWNKAKYLMFTEIVESYKGNLTILVQTKWIEGLFYSLHRSGLVSAGADMYYAVLKMINTQDVWCELFLPKVINLLVGTDTKAIDNFNNYWCSTTLKKFGSIAYLLIEELDKQEDTEECLYSRLCIIKQAKKIGIVHNNLNTVDVSSKQIVLSGINNCNNNIRACAFEIVCASQGKTIPSPMEYSLILDYLYNNINGDSTVLRLNMLKSFNIFLLQLHITFINLVNKSEDGEDILNLIDFCKRLQYFVVINFNIEGNYQRKITSVKLCDCLLTNFSEIPRKKKDQTRQCNIMLKEYLINKSLWLLRTEDFIKKLINLLSDPSEDVRENAVKILLHHYIDELRNANLLKIIINNANMHIRSKFFFEISCGHSMFKLLTNLILKENNSIQAEFRTVEDIFDFAYNEILNYNKTPINIMDSIKFGKQIHAFVNILLIVLEVCINNKYEIDIESKMPELLPVLESISNQFAWEEEGSSDFSKMNSMVQKIIDESEYIGHNDDDSTKISGLQHIVLNCLWLNTKASCDLASILIQYNVHNVDICGQCLNLITHVLETSRHKGVIEAAGTALGRSIQYLTALPELKNISHENVLMKKYDAFHLPYLLLECKLRELITEMNKMSSITRRGAGLSIMVHRIVSSDMQKNKPLFHYFMKTLLHICKTKDCTIDNHPIENMDDDNMENQVDLPKALYIHFMTRIVTDSSLATDTLYYSVDLAELAFGNLTSQHWQIRNAALQLYGALIPRIIGQRKASGENEETIATVACDEMRTHLPQLWEYITNQLNQHCGKVDIEAHSNLIPILNMLANSAKRYNFSLVTTEQESAFDQLFDYLISLLNSPIYTVRRLTARTIFNLYKLEHIVEGMLKQNNVTENLLHGLLILLNLCHNYYRSNTNHDNIFKKLEAKFCCIFNTGTHSYLNRKLFEDIYTNDIDLQCVENTLLEMKNNNSPGVYVWVEARLNKYINKCSWNLISCLLPKLLQQTHYEKYCEYIFIKMKTQDDIPKDTLVKLADILTTFDKRFHSCIVWKIIYEISLKTDYCIKTESLLKILNGKFSYNLRYMIPLMARSLADVSKEGKNDLLAIVNDLSDFENSDVDHRYISALANNELANNFDKLPDYLKVISLKCALLLLQDEDEDIRNVSVKYYSILSKETKLFQPYICLNKILDTEFLCTIFDKPQSSLQDLYKKIYNITLHSNHNKDDYNPFANDCKNIYFEPDVLKQLVDRLKDF